MTAKGLILPAYKRAGRLLGGRQLDERSRLLRAANSFVVSRLRSDATEVQGSKMIVDAKDSLRLLVKGVYEPFETELVRRELKPGDVVLDLGANIGYYTLLCAKLVGQAGKVFAFEPDPDNFAILERNVELNEYENVVAVQAAVSNSSGTASLHLASENKGDHRLYGSQDDRPTIEVETLRLDEYLSDYSGPIDFVKVDIQGAEGMALEGMHETLLRTKPRILLTEFAPASLLRAGTEPRQYLSRLVEIGFALYEIRRQATGIVPTDVATLLASYGPEQEDFANLLCMSCR